jgi:hypothetical protein
MSVEGRISVDVVFHDTDGTNAINVVSLQDSKEYTTGKVAIVSGTIGTTEIAFRTYDAGDASSTYRDASGSLVSFAAITKVALKSTAPTRALVFGDESASISLAIPGGDVLIYPCNVTPNDAVSVRSFSGTASYTVILYGS